MTKVMISATDERRALGQWIERFPEAAPGVALSDVGYELSTRPLSRYRVPLKQYGPVVMSKPDVRFIDRPVREGLNAYFTRGVVVTQAMPTIHLIMEEEKVFGADGFPGILRTLDSAGIGQNHAILEFYMILDYLDRIVPQVTHQ